MTTNEAVDASAQGSADPTSTTHTKPRDRRENKAKKKLQNLQELDAKVRLHHNAQPRGEHDLRSVFSRRGGARAAFGLAEAALEDNLRAYLCDPDGTLDVLLEAFRTRCDKEKPGARRRQIADVENAKETPVPDHALSARLGEALRIYARDVLLSRPDGKRKLSATVQLSVDCFVEAEEALIKSGAEAPDELAWIRAHRGAARALLYWIKISNGKDDGTFDEATADFEQARQYRGKPYEWSIRFHAYLYALRGEPGDFDKARQRLSEVDDSNDIMHATLQRSRAMLFSYDAATATTAKAKNEAARAGLEAGADAVSMDPDDFMGSYFTAANWWSLMLSDSDKALQETHRENLQAAIKSARVRSHNAISQALATLVGLRLMEATPQGPLDELKKKTPKLDAEAVREIKTLQEAFERFPPDLETRSIFMRDPVFTTLKQEVPGLFKQLSDDGNATYDELKKRYSAD